MSKKKIYLSGKITGLPMDAVKLKFQSAEKHFVKRGFDVINPLTLKHDHDKSWSAFMMECLEALIPCNDIAMMHDWAESPGSRIEYDFAMRMSKQVHHIGEWCFEK